MYSWVEEVLQWSYIQNITETRYSGFYSKVISLKNSIIDCKGSYILPNFQRKQFFFLVLGMVQECWHLVDECQTLFIFIVYIYMYQFQNKIKKKNWRKFLFFEQAKHFKLSFIIKALAIKNCFHLILFSSNASQISICIYKV